LRARKRHLRIWSVGGDRGKCLPTPSTPNHRGHRVQTAFEHGFQRRIAQQISELVKCTRIEWLAFDSTVQPRQGLVGAPDLAQRYRQVGLEFGVGAEARSFLERRDRLARSLLRPQQGAQKLQRIPPVPDYW